MLYTYKTHGAQCSRGCRRRGRPGGGRSDGYELSRRAADLRRAILEWALPGFVPGFRAVPTAWRASKGWPLRPLWRRPSVLHGRPLRSGPFELNFPTNADLAQRRQIQTQVLYIIMMDICKTPSIPGQESQSCGFKETDRCRRDSLFAVH